jgi:hypothetical protein
LSEDREDGHRQVEQEIPTILQRLLLGAILGILVTSFEFAGLPWLSSAGSIWKRTRYPRCGGRLRSYLGGGPVLVVAVEDRFGWFCIFCYCLPIRVNI